MNVLTCRRKPINVEAVAWDGTRPEMHRIIAWILDEGGTASIRDGYSDQGPDLISILDKDSKEFLVLPGNFVVHLNPSRFIVHTAEEFADIFEIV